VNIPAGTALAVAVVAGLQKPATTACRF